MPRRWLVIPTRAVAIDVDGLVPGLRDAERLERLATGARDLHHDLRIRVSHAPNPLAYLRLEGEAIERMAPLRAIRLGELQALAAKLGDARRDARSALPELVHPTPR